ncbi:MAG: hypothetical protein JWN25_1936 [Verrucomicrobiales bacterium]|nr:hypothetical protein [Verrucomicrobiales bacterium]
MVPGISLLAICALLNGWGELDAWPLFCPVSRGVQVAVCKTAYVGASPTRDSTIFYVLDFDGSMNWIIHTKDVVTGSNPVSGSTLQFGSAGVAQW